MKSGFAAERPQEMKEGWCKNRANFFWQKRGVKIVKSCVKRGNQKEKGERLLFALIHTRGDQ
jgi:hypothetical protein